MKNMNAFKSVYCRTYQFVLNKVLMPFIRFPEPTLIKGAGALAQAADILKEKGFRKPLLVADPILEKLGKIHPLFDRLQQNNLNYVTYYGVEPNPTFDSVLPALELAKLGEVDSIIAIGGGSTLDVAKIIGACLANKTADIASFRGLFKVRKKFP